MASIIKNKEICGGQPTLASTRLIVFNIISGVFMDGLESYSADHDLSTQNILDAIIYCKGLNCQDGNEGYCYGCIMLTIKADMDNNNLSKNEIALPDNSKIIVEGDNIFLGDKNEFDNARFGQIGWGIAETLYNKYHQNS